MPFLDRISQAQAELEANANLQSYAAKAALDVLADNWRAAISDGASPSVLIADIDDVVAELNKCKAMLALPEVITRVDLLR